MPKPLKIEGLAIGSQASRGLQRRLGKRFGKSGKAFTLLELNAKIVPNRYKAREDGDEGTWVLSSRHVTDFGARTAHPWRSRRLLTDSQRLIH